MEVYMMEQSVEDLFYKIYDEAKIGANTTKKADKDNYLNRIIGYAYAGYLLVNTRDEETEVVDKMTE